MDVMIFTLETVAVAGFLLGPIFRTLYDFFLKVQANPDEAFEKRYWVMMLASLMLGIIVAMTVLPMFLQNLPQGSEWYVFFASLSQGFLLNHVINGILDTKLKGKEATPQ